MKQPYEGIAGTDRDDYLLSLEPEATTHRDMLITTGANLYSACLVGNPAPKVQAMYDRIRPPRPGDLVFVYDIVWSRDLDRRRYGFGILLEHRTEWADTDEEWADQIANGAVYPDEERTTDTVYYVQYGPKAADVCRWENCSVVAIPGEIM